jgi:putative DNA primase/helicase
LESAFLFQLTGTVGTSGTGFSLTKYLREEEMDKPKACTDLGNAERFIAQHKSDLRYCPQLRRWHQWAGDRWEPDGAGLVFQKAKETVRTIEQEAELAGNDQSLRKEIIAHNKRSQAWSRIKAMIKLAESDPEIQVAVADLDTDPMLLNCTNGTIDLRTGELLSHSREHRITKSTMAEYDEKATCPQWLAFLDKIMAGNQSMITYLQKIIGYALTGLMSEQCFFIFNGFGANGKSTFLEIIRKVLGNYAMHTPSSTLLTNNMAIRNDLARLRGSRFVSAVEIGIGKKLNEALTKELTGGDPITSRFLFREYFEQKPSFKLFIAANYKPEIRGMDHGIWRRIRLIPFNVVLSDDKIDRELPGKLAKELSGILSWAVQGCLDWQHHGLVMPDEVRSATLEYRDESDVLSRFLEDRCDQSRDAVISIKNLYDIYQAWSEENADDILTKKTFGHFMKQRGFKQKKSDGFRYWIGLTIKSNNARPDKSKESESEARPVMH